MVVHTFLTLVLTCLQIAQCVDVAYVVQDSKGVGTIQLIDGSSGVYLATSDVSFSFRWPLAQMTTDLVKYEIYLVSYPTNYPGPVLYLFDEKLSQIHAWENSTFSFFDLQFSSKQNVLFGILVTSNYGRTLSKFTTDIPSNTILVDQIFTLPYMWYVNASSYDQETDRYFALINNFPNQSNSTIDQQLVIGKFATLDEAYASVYPINTPDVLVRFIAYSAANKTLFALGLSIQRTSSNTYIFNNQAVISIMHVSGSEIVLQEAHILNNVVDVGPITCDDSTSTLNVFIKSYSEGTDNLLAPYWSLSSLSFDPSSPAAVTQIFPTDGSYGMVTAATQLPPQPKR